MRYADLILLLLTFLPPLALYGHCRRLIRRGVDPTRVGSVATAYGFTPFLCLLYTLATDLPNRLGHAAGMDTLGMSSILVPTTVAQLGIAYAAYLIDQELRETHWTFREYLAGTQRWAIVADAFLLPLLLGLPLVEWLTRRLGLFDYVDTHGWTAIPILGGLFSVSALSAWWTWRWLRVRYEPLPPELAERLRALGERLGVPFARFLVIPTRGGRIANAWVTGLRRGRQTVLLTDYLLAHLSPEEVEAVVAHEAGHARLGHLQARVWLIIGTVAAALGLVGGWAWLAIRVLDLSGPLMVAVGGLLSLLAGPALTPILRRQEFAADRWAAEATGRPDLLAQALEHLDRLNKTDTAQFPRWLRWLIGHPITPQRVAALRAMPVSGQSDRAG